MNTQLKVDPKYPLIIFLSGPGGVGKTTVGTKLQETLTAVGIKSEIVVSSTRSTYARMGVATETDARNLSVDKLTELQTAIFEDYCDNIMDNIGGTVLAGDVKVLIIDRTPYDHSSYFFQQIPSLTLDDIRGRMAVVKDFLNKVHDLVPITKHLVFFPYPRPWSTPSGSADGLRANLDAKTYIWSLSMSEMTKLHLNPEHYQLWSLDDEYRSVEGTALHIIELIQAHQNPAGLPPQTSLE
jgi:hypothetical protein